MSTDASGSKKGKNENDGEGVYHVNERKGRVDHGGEELTGAVILERAGLKSDKYELWTLEGNKVGIEIQPTDVHHVKPGSRFRATIRGTDYSHSDDGRKRVSAA